MLQCWSSEPDRRPSFSNLVDLLSQFLEGMAGYLDIGAFHSRCTNSMSNSKVNEVEEFELLPFEIQEILSNDHDCELPEINTSIPVDIPQC